jgi:hypothetical protein
MFSQKGLTCIKYYFYTLGEEIISRVCEMGLRLRQLQVSLPGKVLLLQLPCHFPGIY